MYPPYQMPVTYDNYDIFVAKNVILNSPGCENVLLILYNYQKMLP